MRPCVLEWFASTPCWRSISVMRSYERLPTRYEAVPRLVPAQCIARLWRRSAGIATRRISAITVASIVDRAAGLVQRRLEVGDCWCTGPDRIEAQALSSLSQFQQWRRLWLFCHDALPRRQSDAHGHGVLRSILKAAVHCSAVRRPRGRLPLALYGHDIAVDGEYRNSTAVAWTKVKFPR